MARAIGVILIFSAAGPLCLAETLPDVLQSSFSPPVRFVGDDGNYRSPLRFDDGSPVATPADWTKRREQILETWWELIGRWPPRIEKPEIRHLEQTRRDLHELHALMAPRPFLVSGGAEDPPQRWQALNHTLAVNKLLGRSHRVAMTNRATHSPTPESNDQIYAFFEHFLKEGDIR